MKPKNEKPKTPLFLGSEFNRLAPEARCEKCGKLLGSETHKCEDLRDA